MCESQKSVTFPAEHLDNTVKETLSDGSFEHQQPFSYDNSSPDKFRRIQFIWIVFCTQG